MADRLGLEEVRRALAEDRAADDITTRLLGAGADRIASASFVAEGRFIVAGLPLVTCTYTELDPATHVEELSADGAWTTAGTVIARVVGPAATLLAGERVALNFLQRLSGIATLTRYAVDAVAASGGRASITHTRKTTPGLRALERYAVTVGGGVLNRGSLAEAILWKDNHWALLGAQSLATVLSAARPDVPIIVEVEDDTQLEQALAAGVRHILVDNQPPARVADWVRRAGPDVTIEASGGITAETVGAYAKAGATRISIGALSHSPPAAPIGCEIVLEPATVRA